MKTSGKCQDKGKWPEKTNENLRKNAKIKEKWPEKTKENIRKKEYKMDGYKIQGSINQNHETHAFQYVCSAIRYTFLDATSISIRECVCPSACPCVGPCDDRRNLWFWASKTSQ